MLMCSIAHCHERAAVALRVLTCERAKGGAAWEGVGKTLAGVPGKAGKTLPFQCTET